MEDREDHKGHEATGIGWHQISMQVMLMPLIVEV